MRQLRTQTLHATRSEPSEFGFPGDNSMKDPGRRRSMHARKPARTHAWRSTQRAPYRNPAKKTRHQARQTETGRRSGHSAH